MRGEAEGGRRVVAGSVVTGNYTPVTPQLHPDLNASLGFLQQYNTSLHCHPLLPFPLSNTFHPLSTFRNYLPPYFLFAIIGLFSLHLFSSSPVEPKEGGSCACSQCTQQPTVSHSLEFRTDALVHGFVGILPLQETS